MNDVTPVSNSSVEAPEPIEEKKQGDALARKAAFTMAVNDACQSLTELLDEIKRQQQEEKKELQKGKDANSKGQTATSVLFAAWGACARDELGRHATTAHGGVNAWQQNSMNSMQDRTRELDRKMESSSGLKREIQQTAQTCTQSNQRVQSEHERLYREMTVTA